MFGAPGANDREPHSSQSPVSPGQRLFDESLSPSSDRGSPIAPPFVSRGGRSPLATRKKSLAGAPSRPRAPDEPTGAAAPRRPKSIAPLNMDLVMGKRRARIARARALAAVAQQRPPQGPVVAAVPMDSESDTGDGSPGSMSYRFSESGTFETRSSASSVRASANAGVVMVVRENGIVPLAVGRPFGNTPSWSRAGPRARSRTAKPSSRVSGRSGGGRHPVTAAEAAAASSSHWSARVVTGPEGRKRGDSLDALDTSTRLEPAARGGGSSSAARSRRAAPDAPEDAAALARNLGNLDIRAGGAARPQPQPLSLPLAPVRGVTPEKAAVSLSPLGCGELASSSAASASVGANASNTPASSNVHRRHFLALDRLGRGASAVVSKALHVPSLTIVAVKVVRIFQDAKRRQFERELHALRSSAMIAPMGLVRPWSESERVAAVTAAAARGSASWSGSGASDSIDDMETTPRAARRKRPRAALSDGSSRGDDAIAVAIEGDDDGLATTHSPWRLPVPCPHIVACHGAFTDAKRATLSIVLEYMDAGSLQDLIDAGLRVPESSLANIARRLCLALLWIHRRRQLHRDIKPSNLLIDARGAVKLSDFGISRDLDGDDGHTMQVKTFVGTLLYMSPERLMTDQAYGPAADIWAVGMSLRTLATGSHPFAGLSYWTLVEALRDPTTYVKLAQLAPLRPVGSSSAQSGEGGTGGSACDASEELRHFIELCLQMDPAERPSAAELMCHPFLQRAKRSKPSAASTAQALAASRAAEAELDVIFERLGVRLAQHLAKHYRAHCREAAATGAARRPFRSSAPGSDATKGLCASSRTAALAEQLGLAPALVRRKFDAIVDAAYAGLAADAGASAVRKRTR